MDAAIRDVLALLDDADDSELSGDEADLVAEPYHELIAAMKELQAPATTRPVIPPSVVTVPAFDPTTNMLDVNARNCLRAERVFEETDLFTDPVSTTNTMAGYLTNVLFHEADFIHEVVPDDRIVMYHCNFGTVVYPGYTPPPKRATGTRKKKTSKPPRKKQGDGSAFNSQMTFVVRTGLVSLATNPITGESIVPTSTPVYKIKIFRTGVVQLPGALTHKIDDVIDCVHYIASTLNVYFHAGELDPAKTTRAINTNPVMKNYKFALKMPDDHILDITRLKRILLSHPHDDDLLPVFDVKYTRCHTKLSVRFSTPIPRKPKKRTCVNIFLRGRINILGAFEVGTTRMICEYLHRVFSENRSELIVREGGIDAQPTVPYEQNVATPTDSEIEECLEALRRYPRVEIDQQAADYILGLIDAMDDEFERNLAAALDEF